MGWSDTCARALGGLLPVVLGLASASSVACSERGRAAAPPPIDAPPRAAREPGRGGRASSAPAARRPARTVVWVAGDILISEGIRRIEELAHPRQDLLVQTTALVVVLAREDRRIER